mmetsp:Transcript_23221/g.64574  ORF Transcript_23221/g.64574 Transcript_23221/m.64574 type:complete len:545 (+) Transcript_23221:71-1705(+)
MAMFTWKKDAAEDHEELRTEGDDDNRFVDEATPGDTTEGSQGNNDGGGEIYDSDTRQEAMLGNTEVVQRGSDFASEGSDMIPKNGFYVCKPYKKEIIAQQLNDNSPGANRRMAIIGALRDLGVKVFIIEAKSIQTTADILHHVQRVVGFVARENRTYRYNPLDMETMVGEDEEHTSATTASLGFQRCLLYQDKTGRLFNLMLSPHSMGQAAQFENYTDTFSNVQAVSMLAIMARSFTCMMKEDAVLNLKPAYLALILGMVFVEETSLSWLNASMFVRASPSVSAHALTSGVGSDWARKACLLCLILAGAATTSGINDEVQKYLTIVGISSACAVLLANLGSRAWHFMAWKPLSYQGPFADFMAYLVAMITGAFYPFMAHRKIHVGGKAGMEHIIFSAFMAAIVYIGSGLEEVHEFAILQNEGCKQDMTNIVVGGWFFAAMVTSLATMWRMPSMHHATISSSDNEPLLIASQASPVGFKVPSLPDYEMDPSLAWTGSLVFLHVQAVFVLGLVLAGAVGLGLVWWGLSDWGEDVVDHVKNSTDFVR